MYINGLPLPKLMLQLIEERRWRNPPNPVVLEELTGIEKVREFEFLDVAGMQRETARSHLIDDGRLALIYGLASSKLEGKPIADPTVLDVDKSILVAVNQDEEAICLDYRTSYDDPRVVVSVSENNQPVRWKTIAPNFTSFVSQLGI
jgi:hypothetical protein